MIAELKRLVTYYEEDLRDAVPGNLDDFRMTLIAFIGPHGRAGADMFYFDIFSQSRATSTECIPFVFGPKRGEMLVSEFDPKKIRQAVEEMVNSTPGDDYLEAASRLSRVFHWEYEDFSPADENDAMPPRGPGSSE